MNLFKLLGIAAAAGAGIGIYVSSVVKDRFGGGGNNFTKVKQSKIQVIELPADMKIKEVKVMVQKNQE